MSGRSRQRGAALLIALLVVALAATMATGLVERGQADVARAQAIAAAERGWQYAGGLDALARDWIRRQREPAAAAAMPAEGVWSDPLPVPGGTVQARVVDLGGRFNLNGLAHPDPAHARTARLALNELLAMLNLAPELAADIAALLRPGPDGVRHRLAHLSELDRIARIDPTVRTRLAPFVVAVPDEAVRVNVNRTSPEVLAAVLEGFSLDSARAVLGRAPFDSVDAVLAQPELRAVAAGPARERLAVESEWFLAQARVRLDDIERFYVRLVGASGSRYDARYVSQGTFHPTASRWLAPTISD